MMLLPILAALCLTVVELFALHKGIDGVALAAYAAAMGVIFGGGIAVVAPKILRRTKKGH